MSELFAPIPLDRLFVAHARRAPQRTALICGERSITYRELDETTARAAAALRARGVGAGLLVGVQMVRSIDWVTAVLAILRAGATALPLPHDYPAARIRAIVELARVQCIVRGSGSPDDESLAGLGVDLRDLCTERAVPADAAEPREADADRIAFVLCSSGSTGQPKLIARSHRSFLHRLHWTWQRHPFEDDDVGCHKAHTTTTHGIYELFEPLLAGAPTVVLADDEVRDLERFWTAIHSRGVTRLLIVPSAMQASLSLPAFQMPPLKVLVLMGERLPIALARRIMRAAPERTAVYSIYGSTEASSTLVCDLRSCAPEAEDLPLGRPIQPDIEALALDAALRPVTQGCTARLYLAGPALFSGYLGQPNLTRRVLVPHPQTGALLYDTRDDVRVAENGDLYFVGRADDTVKIRGFRIELAEVERAIQSCAGVAQAAVVVDDPNKEEPRLLAFYRPRQVGADDVLQQLRQRLPSYMLPAALVGLDAFPLTERSKLDRRRLIGLYRAECAQPGSERPLTAIEARVAAVWESTLGHRRFDADSSFFEVGGSSLSAAVLAHRLREAFGLPREQFPVRLVYAHPSVASQAALLQAGQAQAATVASNGSALVALRRAKDPTQPPLICVAPAGGTLGAYGKLIAALRFEGEIVGIRDPYVTGERDPTESFDRWVDRLLQDVVARFAPGSCAIVAFSSGCAFGLELARRLRAGGYEVRLLVLIDPLSIAADRWWHFGWWAWRATDGPRWVRAIARAIGRVRPALAWPIRLLAKMRSKQPFALTPAAFADIARRSLTTRPHLMKLAALLELNTGRPVALSDVEAPARPADATLRALKGRLAAVMPEIDADTVERIAVQYTLQTEAQCAYRLIPYDGGTLLVEPESTFAGYLEFLLRPYCPRLRTIRLPLGTPPARTASIAKRFGPLTPHFLSMRDDRFTAALAEHLDRALGADAAPRAPSGSARAAAATHPQQAPVR